MTWASGVGSMPGVEQRDFDEGLRAVLGELPELPHLPEVPGRGATADLTGRALAIVADLGADLQPAGWRLTDASGVDHRRARSLLGQDLDTLEEQTQDYRGAFKIQVAGPWTLAATVEKPRGDKVLSDYGARRELAQALAEGVQAHIRDVRRRLPGVDRLIVQVDEPALAAVLGGGVPTASGFGRHRTVHPPEASESLAWVLTAVADADAEPWVHSCASGTPLQLLRGAGACGLSVDLAVLTSAEHEVIAEALDAGETVALGVVPAADPEQPPTDGELTERVLRWLDRVGLDPVTVGDRLVVTATCGMAGSSQQWARQALSLLRATAAHLS